MVTLQLLSSMRQPRSNEGKRCPLSEGKDHRPVTKTVNLSIEGRGLNANIFYIEEPYQISPSYCLDSNVNS